MDLRMSHNAQAIAAAILGRDRAVLQRVGSALWRGALETSNEAKQRAPKFRSEIVTSVGVSRPAPLEQHITFPKRHAYYQEKGTKPGGRPPLAEMVDWIRMKGITPRTPGMTRLQLAHLFRRTIAQRGIPAQPFAEPALDAKRDRINALIRAAVGEGLAQGGSA